MTYGSPDSVWDIADMKNTSKSPLIDAKLTHENSSLGAMTPEVENMGRIAYGIVSPIIITFGIFTNVINIVVLSRPSLRGPTFRYLTWLAVANLLVCLILLPFVLHSHHTPVTFFPAFYLAHLEMPLGNALIASSVYIIVGLSIDRFVAVCHPRKYRNLQNHRVATIRIAISFFTGFFIYVPMTLKKNVVKLNNSDELYLAVENLVVTRTKWWMSYKYLLEISARLGPAALLGFLNIWIIVELKRISKRRHSLAQNIADVSCFPSHSMQEVIPIDVIPEIESACVDNSPDKLCPTSDYDSGSINTNQNYPLEEDIQVNAPRDSYLFPQSLTLSAHKNLIVPNGKHLKPELDENYVYYNDVHHSPAINQNNCIEINNQDKARCNFNFNDNKITRTMSFSAPTENRNKNSSNNCKKFLLHSQSQKEFKLPTNLMYQQVTKSSTNINNNNTTILNQEVVETNVSEVDNYPPNKMKITGTTNFKRKDSVEDINLLNLKRFASMKNPKRKISLSETVRKMRSKSVCTKKDLVVTPITIKEFRHRGPYKRYTKK